MDVFFSAWVFNGLILAGALLACFARGLWAASGSRGRSSAPACSRGPAGEIYWLHLLRRPRPTRRSRVSDASGSRSTPPATWRSCCSSSRARRHFRASLWLDGLVGALAAAAIAAALCSGRCSARLPGRSDAARRGRPVVPARRPAAARLRGRGLRAHRLAAGPCAAAGRRRLGGGAAADGFFLYDSRSALRRDSTLMATPVAGRGPPAGLAAWAAADRRRAGAHRRGARPADARRLRRGRPRAARAAHGRRARTRWRSASPSPRSPP